VLLLIIAALIGWSVYRASKKVTDFVSTVQTTQTRTPKPGWDTYTNVKEHLPAGLQPDFVAFSFDYPKTFAIQPQSKNNFVKVEKYAPGGEENTAENFSVGSATFTPPDAQSDALSDKLLDDLGQQFSRGFHNYKELRKMPATIDGVKSRALLFQADFNETMFWGKTIVGHPPGQKHGVTILLLATSLSPDIKSADDLGVKGESAEILRSFRFQ
jgi:hypothetical protein